MARRSNTKKKPEDVFKDDVVIPGLQKIGYTIYHTWMSIHSPAGFPDIVAFPPAHRDWPVLALELKVGRNTMTPHQVMWVDGLHGRTIVASEARPENFADIVREALGEDVIA